MSKPRRPLSQAPPPQQAGPSGDRCGAVGEPAWPGSGPVPAVSSLGPGSAPPPPEAMPLDESGVEGAQGQAGTEPRLLGGSPGPALGSPSSSARGPWRVLQAPPPSGVPLPRQAAADPQALGENEVLQAGRTHLAAAGVSSVLAIHLGSISPALLFLKKPASSLPHFLRRPF